MESAESKSLLNVLQEGGVLSAYQRTMVETFVRSWSVTPFVAVVETKVLTERKLATALARLHGMEFVRHLSGFHVPREAFDVIDFCAARQFGIFPLGWTESPRRFWCAVADPTHEEGMREVKSRGGEDTLISVAEIGEIRNAVNRLYPVECQVRCR